MGFDHFDSSLLEHDVAVISHMLANVMDQVKVVVILGAIGPNRDRNPGIIRRNHRNKSFEFDFFLTVIVRLKNSIDLHPLFQEFDEDLNMMFELTTNVYTNNHFISFYNQ